MKLIKELAGKTGASVKPGEPDTMAVGGKRFRRLKYNELVSVGDFVVGKDHGFEPWDGPRGFQAGSFVQPIYRQEARRSTKPKKADN